MSEHLGTVENGRFAPDDVGALKRDIATREGKRSALSFGAIPKARAGQRNKLMWSVYRKASVDLGYTPEELHATFCAMFTTDENGIVRGTRNMETVEHIEYLGKVVRKLAEMGCVIPIDMVD